MMKQTKLDIITIGGGCFWCVEGVFSTINGVSKTEIGYGGGDYPNPTYTSVSARPERHAELTRLWYDPNIITLNQILVLFFEIHNPCKLSVINDKKGELYRSVILFETEEDKTQILKFLKQIQSNHDEEILTEVKPFKNYKAAASNYQNYFQANPNKPFCINVITPKIKSLMNSHKHLISWTAS